MRRKRGFTLIEAVVVAFLVAFVSMIIYKLFSGTFSNFFKTQTKLTNLRAASVLLEHLKHDVRLATIPTNEAAKPKIASSADSLTFRFEIQDTTRKMVTYEFKDGVVTRMEDGRANRTISQAKVGKFFIDDPTLGTSQILKVEIEVDDELEEDKRSANSKGNMVRMTAVLFPRFFQSFTDKEEEYWAKARQLAGGKS
ncbi:MAG: prepilin-type N-terminal cleavage/methylation domain-containing protein [Candidatus Riflebacteria bacterium]|nr:prepilin-type N-terminal cleavage/methylation domain-containing protein [Candidatus Riflebacteria bacterium]